MAKDPAFLFYPEAFLVGVLDLTMEERGQYITMMCLQHQKGHLSENIIKACVGTVADKVMQKFSQDDNGLYYNERLEEEIIKRERFAESRRNNGKKGGRPKQEPNTPVVDTPVKTKPVVAKKPNKIKFADFVEMTQAEYDKLISAYGETAVKWFIGKLDNYKGSSGKKYVSDYRAILSWVVKSYEESQTKARQPQTAHNTSSFDIDEVWEGIKSRYK